MSGIRAVVIIRGFNADGDPVEIVGVETQTLVFSEDFNVEVDRNQVPPVTKVSLRGFGPSSIPIQPLVRAKPRT